MDRANRRARKP